MTDQQSAPVELMAFLEQCDLACSQDDVRWTALTGGVSSDIWKVELPHRTICIKRALAKLKVAANWIVPVSRNAFEWEWIKFAAHEIPGSVPQPIAQDLEAGVFAMEFLAAEQHPVWKQQLLDGHIEPSVAGALGKVIGQLHARSTDSTLLAKTFATDENFDALRLDPYLRATATKHPHLADTLLALAQRTGSIHTALVHGDVSPKNILVGPNGPVILDAECAWYGDPAFDVAFLLNHLLLKCLINPDYTTGYLACFNQFVLQYFAAAPLATRDCVEARATQLLPALLLARIDGKSPVEYLQDEAPKAFIRIFASRLILTPATDLNTVAAQWQAALNDSN